MRSLFRSVALLSLLTLCSLVHADDKAVQKALTANYAKLDQAFQKNDPNTFSGMLSPDYVAIQPNNNKMTSQEVIANFKREHDSIKSAALKSKITSVSVKGDQATAKVHVSLSGVMADPRSKQPHNVVMVVESEDTWVKKGGGWKLKVYQMNSQATIVDGKPLGPTITRSNKSTPGGTEKTASPLKRGMSGGQ